MSFDQERHQPADSTPYSIEIQIAYSIVYLLPKCMKALEGCIVYTLLQ